MVTTHICYCSSQIPTAVSAQALRASCLQETAGQSFHMWHFRLSARFWFAGHEATRAQGRAVHAAVEAVARQRDAVRSQGLGTVPAGGLHHAAVEGVCGPGLGVRAHGLPHGAGRRPQSEGPGPQDLERPQTLSQGRGQAHRKPLPCTLIAHSPTTLQGSGPCTLHGTLLYTWHTPIHRPGSVSHPVSTLTATGGIQLAA